MNASDALIWEEAFCELTTELFFFGADEQEALQAKKLFFAAKLSAEEIGERAEDAAWAAVDSSLVPIKRAFYDCLDRISFY